MNGDASRVPTLRRTYFNHHLNLDSEPRHDAIRMLAKRNEMEVSKLLKKNGRFFVPPTRDYCNFKELFEQLATVDTDQAADEDEFPLIRAMIRNQKANGRWSSTLRNHG